MPYILNPDGSVSRSSDNRLIVLQEDGKLNTFQFNSATNYLLSALDVKQNTGYSYLLNDTKQTYVNHEELTDWDEILEGFDFKESADQSNILNDVPLNHGTEDGNLLAEPETVKSYKPLYSFLSDNSDSGLYAQEFEIKTGYRSPVVDGQNNVDITEIYSFLINYIADVAIQVVFIEGVKLVNNAFFDDATQVKENYHLKLGNYTYTEFDVFTRYVNKVLNYPNDRSSILDRICAFLLGLIEYIAINKTLDYSELVEGLKSENVVFLILGSLVETLAELLLDDSNNKRIIALNKKFKQEKYWVNTILYKNDNKDNFDSAISKFFNMYNYYFFKFTIERINIGLKIIKKYIGKTSNDISNTISRTNTIRSSYDNLKDDKLSVTHNQYNWTNKNSINANEYFKTKTKESSTRIRALPNGLLLNNSLLSSIILNKKEDNSEIINIQPDILQNFAITDEKRLSAELVEELENTLESEYMPFYMHDLRTNEILSFHAFIDNISDSFSPEYTSSSGFGRIDDVKAYVKTTRTINVSFILAATSQSDHDMMWYQINKLVAMVYPQWSQGVKNSDPRQPFTFPFTQVPTASPLIRLRVGDVIKSNYSRTNLSRLHGTDLSTNTQQNIKNVKNYELQAGIYAEKSLFGNETKNIVLNQNVKIDILSESNIFGSNEKYYKVKIIDKLSLHDNKILIVDANKIIFLNSNIYNTETTSDFNDNSINDSIKNYTLGGAAIGAVAGATAAGFLTKDLFSFNTLGIVLGSTVIGAGIGAATGIIVNKDEKLSEIKDDMKEKSQDEIKFDQGFKDHIKNSKQKNQSIMRRFVDPGNKINNPITAAYESGMGRGLAGFITNLDLNYNESTWETSRIGSKAPIFVKITMGFSPIHDIAPGLDHNGMLRAPVYNVGRVNNELFGDPLDGAAGHGEGFNNALNKYNIILGNSNNYTSNFNDDIVKPPPATPPAASTAQTPPAAAAPAPTTPQ